MTSTLPLRPPADAVGAQEVQALLERSHRLGADLSTTNYGGGNTSCKSTGKDPVTGEVVELLHVKGSGGDLGTLTRAGLAVLRLDRVRALRALHSGSQDDDRMVDLLAHCGHLPGGAAPSIDTAMHALLTPRHVDHLHPDAVIALAACTDGERLVRECYGGRVGWVDWQRPGFSLALSIEAELEQDPDLQGVVLGGHGLTTWGTTSDNCEQRSFELIGRAADFLAERGRDEPFGPVVPAWTPLSGSARRARAAALAPLLRGLSSTDGRVVGHFDDRPLVLDFLSRSALPRLAPLGTSCPDHFLRTKVRPLLLDLGPEAPLEASAARLRELHEQYRVDYAAYYARYAEVTSPPMRGADPVVWLLPGVGMWTFAPDKPTARVAAEYYVNAINVMRGAEAVSEYVPIAESEKFRVEYWELEEAKMRRRPAPAPLTGRVALVTGGGSGIGRATAQRLAADGACVVVADLDEQSASRVAEDLGSSDRAVGVFADVGEESSVSDALEAAVLAFGGVDLVVNNAGLSVSAPLQETTVEVWDQQHRVMARGSFLVSRAAARILEQQGLGGDIVYIVSKNSVVAGAANLAYSAAKADQAHQVRLLAAELGALGIRVNGVNPDGVVAGSGIFAGGWGARRAEVYGVPEKELGAFYAQRTLLKREVLPEHVADAVLVLTAGQLPLTTGTIIPVDSGVPAAFLR